MAAVMKLFKFLVGTVLVIGLLGAGFVALTVWHFSRGLPDYEQLAEYQPPIVTRVHAGDGRLLAEYATEKRVFVPVKDMPPLVINAFLAAEDRNFYSHPGIDPLSIARAAVTDLVHMGSKRRPVGASTITQQVAKNFLLTNEVSVERKVKEALLALRMERALSKDRILELYLNEIYLGGGTYGVGAAALNYFNKPLDQLTIEEAAYLGALPKAPNNYNPTRYPEAAKGRRDWVIDRMQEAGFISREKAAMAMATPLQTRRREEAETVSATYFGEEVRRELLGRYGEKALYQSGFSVRTSVDPALQVIADKALRAGLIAYDRRHGWRGPVGHIDASADWAEKFKALPVPAGTNDAGWEFAVVTATDGEGAAIGFADGRQARIPFEEMRWARQHVDDDKQGPAPREAKDVVSKGDTILVENLNKPGRKGEPLYALRQMPAVSGAVVALDPHTGRVLALSGGFSYEMSQFNRATQAKRQPGSSIKPFIYLAALDHGFTPASLVLDAPFVVDQGPGLPKWNPTNYTHKFYGPLTLRVGIEQSRNLITARIGSALGVDTVGEYVERFGIMDRMPRQPAMFLGAQQTTPLKMTLAYAMLVNGGKRIKPTFIDRVQDRNGQTIYKADSRPCETCRAVDWNNQAPPELPDTRDSVADPRSVYQIVSILQGVVDSPVGTGHSIASLGKPLAGKTGTTNESNDTWFVGFSADLAVGVYVGFDSPESLGTHETGASAAAPIFKDFMASALKDRAAPPFRIPPGIRLVRVNATTGQLARAGERNTIYEAFKPGTEPTGQSTVLDGSGGSSDEPTASSFTASTGVTGVASEQGRAVPASGTGGLY